MSYVPPHLRNSSSTSFTKSSSLNLDSFDQSKLSCSSNFHFNNSSFTNTTVAAAASSSSSSSSASSSPPSTFSNGYRRVSSMPTSVRALHVPDPVFHPWKPSDRVLRLTPEQVRLFHSEMLSSLPLFWRSSILARISAVLVFIVCLCSSACIDLSERLLTCHTLIVFSSLWLDSRLYFQSRYSY